MVNSPYLIGAGAVVGALLRYATSQYVGDITEKKKFPYGTFIVNIIGTFVLAYITFIGASDAVLYAVGTGACGSYTTFSSFSVDTVQLWEQGDHSLAGWYAIGNLIGALAAIGIASMLANTVGAV